MQRQNRVLLTGMLAFLCLGAAVWLFVQPTYANESVSEVTPIISRSPLHPPFALLDEQGANVLTSGNAISTMRTCGTCHDTEFIASHSFHTDVGLTSQYAPDSGTGIHTWDTSAGYFGRWNAFTYRYLSAIGDTRTDLTTADWIRVYGARHVGGGPAVNARDGQPLTSTVANRPLNETGTIDPQTGELVAWDWQASGGVEMNCFLCHMATPNNNARIHALESGTFQWANTATLVGTGIVEQTTSGYTYAPAAFSADGNLLPEYITVQDPTSANCGQCHGVVQTETGIPLGMTDLTISEWSTLTTGQIYSPQRMKDSALNLSDKETLERSWDVHAERVLRCTSCHYALNNPVYFQETAEEKPDHLSFDPRRLDFGEYLYRPLHQFAKGQSYQSDLAPEYDNTLRRCESCHEATTSHDWLPYVERHLYSLTCESCHIPEVYAPALAVVDWTAVTMDGSPLLTYRGTEGGAAPSESTLITGYQPVLLPRQNADGTTSLAPFNLVTAWYWVYGEPARPVPQRDLQAAYLAGNQYQPDVFMLFDANQDGTLDKTELRLDTPEKVALITEHLADRDLPNPRMVGEMQPYNLHHGVTTGTWATKDCQTCHSTDSRLVNVFPLSDYQPYDVQPTWVSAAGVANSGSTTTDAAGRLVYTPTTNAPDFDLYIFGHEAIWWIDWLGILMFLGVLIGISVHGGLRYLAARRLAGHHTAETKSVYMYAVYERFWHWMQTILILGLAFTGLVIHKPDKFALFSFGFVVVIHNIFAVLLVINAALSLFYHLVSGEIQQYIPRPYGFFDQMIVQAKYYLIGIFRNEPHPFEKIPERKLNPLQQITYFGILNVLLPLQVITGALMWAAKQFPEMIAQLGGLPFLAPFHTLIAWTFISFIVGHVYLTTTGHTPLANIKAMMLGWDDVESMPTNEH